MKTFILFWFLAFSNLLNAQLRNESDIYFQMKLEPVINCNAYNQKEITIASTVPSLLVFCDRAVRLPIGVFRIRLDIADWEQCHIITSEDDSGDSFKYQPHSQRVIEKGLQRIDYTSSSIISIEDYIEYTVCDYIIYSYSY